MYSYYRVAQGLARALSEKLGREVPVLKTNGSLENIELLKEGRAELAPVHFGSSSFTDDGIRIVTVLYYGSVHVVVRKGRGIAGIRDFRYASYAVDGADIREIDAGRPMQTSV